MCVNSVDIQSVDKGAMMGLNLGFDLDEVVVNLTDVLEKYMKDTYDIYWPAEYFIEYGIMGGKYNKDMRLNKIIQEDLFKVVNSPELQLTAKPFNGAKEALLLLKEADHKIFFVTSRPETNTDITLEWLRSNNIQFDSLEVIGRNKEKGVYGNKLNLDMFVDDLEKHLVSMLKHKKVWSKGLLLFNRPWNTEAISFDRVDGWVEILKVVENNT